MNKKPLILPTTTSDKYIFQHPKSIIIVVNVFADFPKDLKARWK